MKLCIKQAVFTWVDRFSITDEWGNERYYAEGEFFSWGKKLHVYDMQGKEIAFIEQKLFSFLPTYYIHAAGQESLSVVKEFTFFRPCYTIGGKDWTVEGEFWEHEYSVFDRKGIVFQISKEWFTWGDCYLLEIASPADELTALCTALVIDCVTAQQND